MIHFCNLRVGRYQNHRIAYCIDEGPKVSGIFLEIAIIFTTITGPNYIVQ